MAKTGRPRKPSSVWIDPSDGVGRVQLTQGAIALVDADDLPRVASWAWHLADGGYAQTNVPLGNGKYRTVKMHQMILETPNKREIDHISRDKLDNRKSNLRAVTHKQNQENRPSQRNSHTSKYRGVHRCNHSLAHPWHAQVSHNKQKIMLGCHATEEDAARAYDAWVRTHRDAYAYLNFPDK